MTSKGFKEKMQAVARVTTKDEGYDNTMSFWVGKETVDDELAGNSLPKNYNLTDVIRDVLITHTRQDGSHALANTSTILQRLYAMNKLMVRYHRWLVALTLLTAFMLVAIFVLFIVVLIDMNQAHRLAP